MKPFSHHSIGSISKGSAISCSSSSAEGGRITYPSSIHFCEESWKLIVFIARASVIPIKHLCKYFKFLRKLYYRCLLRVLKFTLWPWQTHFCVQQLGYALVLVVVFFSHCPFIVELRPSSSLPMGYMVSLRGHWATCCHNSSGRVGRVWSPREKSLEIYSTMLGIEPGPQGAQTVTFIHSPAELSWWTSNGLFLNYEVKINKWFLYKSARTSGIGHSASS